MAEEVEGIVFHKPKRSRVKSSLKRSTAASHERDADEGDEEEAAKVAAAKLEQKMKKRGLSDWGLIGE